MTLQRALTSIVLVFASTACAGGGAQPPAPSPSPHEAGPEVAADAPPPPLVEGRDYAVYRADGTPASFADIVRAMSDADAVLVGEEHDDVVTHRLQLALLERAFTESGRDVVLSLEMFERDVQVVVDEYLADLITETHFRASARPWNNYEADYRPMVEFAKAHRLPVVAANAPRRYVNRASRLGRESLETLSAEARKHLPPLPYPDASDAYREQWDQLMGEAAQHMSGAPLDGQTLWDAAMGHSIARALDRHDGALVLHLAGGFHVERDTGIPDVLRHYRPWTRVLIVAARPADDPGRFDPERYGGLGDFVILTSGERATSPPAP